MFLFTNLRLVNKFSCYVLFTMEQQVKVLHYNYLYFAFYYLVAFKTLDAHVDVLFFDERTGIDLPGLFSATGQNISEADHIFAFDPVISDPLIEINYPAADLLVEVNKKRNAIDYKWTNEDKMKILDIHNIYRGNVTPPAGNMAFMEWDEDLEHFAELWAEGCHFEHGRPPNTTYKAGYGQNLYLGSDPTGLQGLWLWYQEYHNYYFHNKTCQFGKVCGHYLTMAWASNSKIGCATHQCGNKYFMVCHYSPGATKNSFIYDVSKPCSQCISKPGDLCYKNLCITKEQCKRQPKKCELAVCNLECHNCGRLNKEDCSCTCADGWDTHDCSRPCQNVHERCGIYPGYPTKSTCSLFNHKVENEFCRLMCGKCDPFFENETVTHDIVNHVCCKGKMCPRGYVLDMQRKPCTCTTLCPGPTCDFIDGHGNGLVNNLMLLLLLLTVATTQSLITTFCI